MNKISIAQLSALPPSSHTLDKAQTKKKREKMARQISELLHIMYAQGKHNLLIVLQGMDATGKNGTTKKVFSYTCPSIIDAFPFKKPTELEFAHDFLWRVHRLAPPKGQTHVFMRSHYEDILIQRVHHWIDESQVRQRMDAINAFERLLVEDNNTTILKFYLHISPERQKEKLQERIDNPLDQWKHNAADWEERNHWDSYMKAYEDILNWSQVPWHVVPVDKKWYRDYYVAKVVLDTLKTLDLKLPTLPIEK